MKIKEYYNLQSKNDKPKIMNKNRKECRNRSNNSKSINKRENKTTIITRTQTQKGIRIFITTTKTTAVAAATKIICQQLSKTRDKKKNKTSKS